MTAPVKARRDVPEMLAVAAVIASAVVLFVFGGFLSAIAFALAGVMGWTRGFAQDRAQGKPTLSGTGRVVTACVLVVLGIVFLPRAGQPMSKTEQPSQPITEPERPSAPTFGKMEAIDACKSGVAARASHPSTVEFPMLDYDFREYADNKSKLLMSAKARNGFNLLVEFDVECDFAAGKIARVLMSEAGPRQ